MTSFYDDMKEMPPKPGYTRIYEDHTGRNWTDYSPEEMEEMANDPFVKLLREEIQKEINRDIVEKLRDVQS